MRRRSPSRAPIVGAGTWPLKPPTISAKTRGEFVIHFFGNEMKYLDASNHFIRERRPVRCDYWSIVFARFTGREFLWCISLVITGASGWILPPRIYWLVGPSRMHQRA